MSIKQNQSSFIENLKGRKSEKFKVEPVFHDGKFELETLSYLKKQRYLDFLNRDPLIKPVHGILAAQEIRPQAKVLAEDRGIKCVVIDYDEIRGIESNRLRLF